MNYEFLATTPSSVPPERSAVVERVTLEGLSRWVDAIARPRHFDNERAANREVAEYLTAEFHRLGATCHYQGRHRNVVAHLARDFSEVRLLVGAHYDSVPGTPGADDNASGVAAMLAACQALAEEGPSPIAFVAFNREEDGLLGSADFVASQSAQALRNLREVHILEMLGCRRAEPGSQGLPAGLNLPVGDVGDFLAVIGNGNARAIGRSVLDLAGRFNPRLPVKFLGLSPGLEQPMAHLLRSDHAAFWQRGVPALMWTDTAEFRNPNYHQPSDVPETLDFEFLRDNARLLVARLVAGLLGDRGNSARRDARVPPRASR